MPIDHFLSLLQSSGKSSRSTALQPLVWLVVVLALTFLGSLRYHAPSWALIAISCVGGIAIVVYLGSYVYLIGHNIDATRSERFVLEKIALQQSRIGDDRVGFSDDRRKELLGIPATVSPKSESGEAIG